MFTESAPIYDAIYESFHDFAAEADTLHTIIQQHILAPDNTLLDVACGTGAYLVPLRRRYVVDGVDLDPGMIAVARRKLPDVPLHQADMVDFDLGRRFAAVVCLGSSIGYARTIPRLRQTIASLARHTLPGGLVVVEPWFSPEDWEVGRLNGLFVDRDDLKVARMSVSRAEGAVSILEFHYLIATPTGIQHLTEHHEMGLFTHHEYLDAFTTAGLAAHHDPTGLIGRGLYIGLRR